MEREHLEAKADDLFTELVEHALARVRAKDMTAAEMAAALKIVAFAGVRYTPSSVPHSPPVTRDLPFSAVEDEIE